MADPGSRFYGPFGATGESVGAASAITVQLDFKPIYIEVVNTTTKSIYYWTQPHGAAGATKVVDSGVGTTDISTVTTNAITAGNGGFIMGTGVQTTNDVIYWTAFRDM
jgi:hypothetical protein